MILWDKLEEIRKEHVEQEIEIIIYYNKHRITDYMPYSTFHMNIALDILNMEVDKQVEVIDKTIENENIKVYIRNIFVNIKKEVFE